MLRKIILMLLLFKACSMTAANDNLKWIDVKDSDIIKICGLPWYEENCHKFYRIPYLRKELEEINSYVKQYQRCPSGARVRFKTDSTTLRVKVVHGMGASAKLYATNLSTISASGMDLYVGPPDAMSFWMTTEPTEPNDEYQRVYFQDEPHKMRELTLYLPTYSELERVEIGVDPNSVLLAPTPYKIKKPIVFYGTSITQGASSSRGSNGYVPIVGRRLNADVVNLGFSSGGCCEESMAHLMAEIDATIYVVAPVENMSVWLMDQRYEKFIRILREKRPNVPVVLMTAIHGARDIEPDRSLVYETMQKSLFQAYERLKDQYTDKVFLFDTGKIIRPGGDNPTIDAIHPTDLGFKIISDELVPFLEAIINNPR